MLTKAGMRDNILEGKEFVLATNNPHKVEEISRLFSGFRIKTPSELGIDFQYEETGGSFVDNALGKARGLLVLVHRPVLADDSGLCVAALQGGPGIYSARYGSLKTAKDLTDRQRIDYLLAEVEKSRDRSCFFVCCMVLLLEEHRFVTAQETVHGELAQKPVGSGGFGYDPVFYLPHLKKTVAELTDREKDKISHRGRAARRILKLIGPC